MEYLLSLAGGVLIGIAALVMWLGLGRIMGMSSITGGVIWEKGHERIWRLCFVVATIVGAFAVSHLMGIAPSEAIRSGWVWPVIAGLLVGFGTGIGSGCTSGHGVCGIGRLSPRSIIATCVFMASGIATVAVMRIVMGG